jgi:uncharacterized membrane protein required for colicin V production
VCCALRSSVPGQTGKSMGILQSINLVDLAALLAVLWGMVRGFRRGLSGELSQLIGAAAALVFGINVYRPLGAWLAGVTRLAGRSAGVGAFLATLAAALVVWIALRALFRRLMRVVIEEQCDTWLGLAAGAGRALLFIAMAVVAMTLWPNPTLNRVVGEESLAGRTVLRLLPAFTDDAP